MTSINLIQVRIVVELLTITGSEYPIVDGHLSINVYLNALEKSYETFKNKYKNYHG